MAPEILRHDFCRNYLSGLVVKVSLRRTCLAARRNIMFIKRKFHKPAFLYGVASHPGEIKYGQSWRRNFTP
jgi:hypothetical protein